MHEYPLGHVSRALQRGRAAVFCGAGISLNSGLPTANALIGTILSRLQASQETRACLLGSGLPFEAFMEIVKNMVGIDELLDIFRQGRPNGTHRCIAELVRRRWVTTVCTTNFDTLIEAALAAAGLSEERDYVVLRASSDFATFDWDDARPRLLKMHGSIDSPGTLAISLRDVASRILSAGRQIAIERIFSADSHNAVIVLGYSCSDIFDISPAIESLPSHDTEVILIEHLRPTEPPREPEDIHAAAVKNPFRRFKTGRRYFADTDEVVDKICKELDIIVDELAPTTSDDSSGWQELAESWSHSVITKYSQAALDITLGSLLYSIGELAAAREHFERSLSRSRELRDVHSEIMSLVNLSGVLVALADLEEARAHLDLAATMARSVGDSRLELSISLSVARLKLASVDVRGGLQHLAPLVSRAKELGDRSSEVAILGDLGIGHLHLGELDRALRFFGEALTLAREIGDKHGEGLRLGNLGQVYSQQGRLFDAISCFQQARQIAEEIGDIQASGIHSYNLGTCYLALGIPSQATEEFRRAVGSFHRVFHDTHPAVLQAQQMLENLERGL
jgi:tetratricopeptide (TPR) repeat protein